MAAVEEEADGWDRRKADIVDRRRGGPCPGVARPVERNVWVWRLRALLEDGISRLGDFVSIALLQFDRIGSIEERAAALRQTYEILMPLRSN